MTRADAAVTTALVLICLAREKMDATKGKKLGELKAQHRGAHRPAGPMPSTIHAVTVRKGLTIQFEAA